MQLIFQRLHLLINKIIQRKEVKDQDMGGI